MTDFGVGDHPNNIEVRRWAQEQPWGGKVPVTGDLPRPVIVAWNRAHPHRTYVRQQAFHGTPSGYINRDCRCRRCTDAHSALITGKRQARRSDGAA